MRRFFKSKHITLVFAALLISLFAMPQSAAAYNAATHTAINSQAIILLRDNSDLTIKTYGAKLYSTVNYLGYSYTPAQIIMSQANYPDSSQTDGMKYLGHFYSPVDEKNYMGNTSPTAKTRFIETYNAAVKAYRGGLKYQGWSNLGRALHYLGDLNAPHHVWNYQGYINTDPFCHSECEKYFDNVYNNYTATSLSSSQAKAYFYSDINGLPKTWAQTAKNNSYYLGTTGFRNLSMANKQYKYGSMAGACLPSAEREASAVILRFMKDVGLIY